jgi:hypothetical protein
LLPLAQRMERLHGYRERAAGRLAKRPAFVHARPTVVIEAAADLLQLAGPSVSYAVGTT